MDPGMVSALQKSETKEANILCIFDAYPKLLHNNYYDIGGTYSDGEPEFWFGYHTQMSPGKSYLLSLFVCNRKAGSFSIGVSQTNKMTYKVENRHELLCRRTHLDQNLGYFCFSQVQKDTFSYIKTYYFSEADVESLRDIDFHIFLKIKVDESRTLNMELVKQIKLGHDFGELLSKPEQSDCFVEASDGHKVPAHKIILGAHSSVFRQMFKNLTTSSIIKLDDISKSDLELLLQFIYTGAVEDIVHKDCLSLIKLATKYDLAGLTKLSQHALIKQINVDNVVEIALLSETYNLSKLQEEAFSFIKDKPEVLKSDGWDSLNDVKLTKKLFQYMYAA